MASPVVSFLLIGICCLAFVKESTAECCTSKEEVTFRLDRGDCEDVRGSETIPSTAKITICADGVAQVGTYCGRGSCNIFGCNCDGGCLEGDWTHSFVQRYRDYGIEILEVVRIPF
ncbi:LOW QUALITY PROTEIN: protein Diedel-like [Drosophila takahashii]|uniref:LOW QUALITY PROTEIN: protein Diedel-like n=1 Tax=Drosophila takahashii TaxID=29030 RepID=UPI001CF7FCAD|nr:LOW QUALITY PROTEIN: protein Diedel-like [Drosophila takahashii]